MDQVKKKKSNQERSSEWSLLEEQLQHEQTYDYPRLTIVIPTHNSAQSIDLTMGSVTSQNYPDLEIIVVDACSKDRTMQIVKSYHESISRVYTVTDYNLYEMMNRGISLARGTYICFFFPGDFYVSKDALGHMMRLAIDNEMPDLVYCACLLRNDNKEPWVLLRPLNVETLKKGKQPTSIQSCWFRVDTLRKVGKFQPLYSLRGGYDLFCRLRLVEKLRVAISERVLTDYDRRELVASHLIRYSNETLSVIFKRFGFIAAFKWWVVLNHFRIVKWWLKRLKAVFLGIR
ncbi:MAG: glycosyltransferase involved in cell wall biosynthesis [Chlamydiales bacterium]|jgi:glycosyltransferase involved in cell wall biosynthesis